VNIRLYASCQKNKSLPRKDLQVAAIGLGAVHYKIPLISFISKGIRNIGANEENVNILPEKPDIFSHDFGHT